MSATTANVRINRCNVILAESVALTREPPMRSAHRFPGCLVTARHPKGSARPTEFDFRSEALRSAMPTLIYPSPSKVLPPKNRPQIHLSMRPRAATRPGGQCRSGSLSSIEADRSGVSWRSITPVDAHAENMDRAGAVAVVARIVDELVIGRDKQVLAVNRHLVIGLHQPLAAVA